jgi:hypothetical protein
MDEYIEFVSSAFKHGVAKEAILQALERPRYEDLMEGYANKHLVLGFDGNANLLEIMYNIIGPEKIRVFHAMPCRRPWEHLANH